MTVEIAGGQGPWIRSKRWDLTWLAFSALLVPIAPMLFHYAGVSAFGVAIIVLLLVGGPHVAVTFTRTMMDPGFRKRYPRYTWLALFIPILTAAFAFNATSIFLMFFFAWASFHVLQQMCYIVNGYSNRQGDSAPSRRERYVEYGVILSCLYPLATVRMIRGEFILDGVEVWLPAFAKHPWLVWAASITFAIFFIQWLGYTIRRARAGTLHNGKTALISMTILANFFIPLVPNLDAAFQGINTWHCVQYLALTWWINRQRAAQGKPQDSYVAWVSAPGKRGFARYYLISVAVSAGIFGLVLGAQGVFSGTSKLLIYYAVAKGLLLTHYYFDSFLFTRRDEITTQDPGAPESVPGVPAGA